MRTGQAAGTQPGGFRVRAWETSVAKFQTSSGSMGPYPNERPNHSQHRPESLQDKSVLSKKLFNKIQDHVVISLNASSLVFRTKHTSSEGPVADHGATCDSQLALLASRHTPPPTDPPRDLTHVLRRCTNKKKMRPF